MDWIEKIKEGMALIGEGCREAGIYENCLKCPLCKACLEIDIALDKADLSCMAGWRREE